MLLAADGIALNAVSLILNSENWNSVTTFNSKNIHGETSPSRDQTGAVQDPLVQLLVM